MKLAEDKRLITDAEIEKLQNLRSDSIKKKIIPGLALAIVVYIINYLGIIQLPSMLFLFLLVLGIGYALNGLRAYKSAEYLFKTKLMEEVLGAYYTDIRYNPSQGLSESDLAYTEFFRDYDRMHSHDLIQGSYGPVSFTMADVKTERENKRLERKDGKPVYVTQFEGQVMFIDFHEKILDANVMIHEGRVKGQVGYEIVKTENALFQDKFTVQSSDPHTVFYLLTPHFIERILQIEETRKGDLKMLFKDQKLMVAMDTRRDSFTMNGVKDYKKARELFHSEMRFVVDVVEELKLNKDLFKGEK